MMLLSVVAENYRPLLLLADPCCLSKSIKNDVLTIGDFFPTSTDRELFSISDLRCVVVKGTSERSVSCVNVIIVLKLAVLQTSAPKGLQSSCQGKGSPGRSRFMKSHSAGFTPWKTLVGKVWVLAPTGILIVPPADLCDFGNLLSSLGQFPYLWYG